MNGMAVAAGAAGLVVRAEGPVHQLAVLLVAARAFLDFRHPDRVTGLGECHDALAGIDMATLARLGMMRKD